MKPKNVGAALIPFEPKMRVDTVLDDGAYQEFLAHNGKGLQFALQDRGSGKPGTLPDRYGDFAKWLRQHHPSVPVALPPSIGPIHALRDSHVWLPVVMLAADTSVQLFLNIAAGLISALSTKTSRRASQKSLSSLATVRRCQR